MILYTGGALHIAEPYKAGMAPRYLTSVLFELSKDFVHCLEQKGLKESALSALWEGFVSN